MRHAPRRVAAAVFDCDGLLVDSETLWARAEASVVTGYGFEFDPEIESRLVGLTIETAGAVIADHVGHPADAEKVAAALLDHVLIEIAAGAEPMPGAMELVRACAERVPVAVASNSSRALLDLTLQRAGLAALLPVSVAADEVDRPKPDPQPYLQACTRLGVEPAATVAFEDSPTGARSARAAGLYVIAVPSLPGVEPDHDWRLTSLTDPELRTWAAALSPRIALG